MVAAEGLLFGSFILTTNVGGLSGFLESKQSIKKKNQLWNSYIFAVDTGSYWNGIDSMFSEYGVYERSKTNYHRKDFFNKIEEALLDFKILQDNYNNQERGKEYDLEYMRNHLVRSALDLGWHGQMPLKLSNSGLTLLAGNTSKGPLAQYEALYIFTASL